MIAPMGLNTALRNSSYALQGDLFVRGVRLLFR